MENSIRRIAREQLGFKNLNCPRIEFREVSLWSARQALEAAYMAGMAAQNTSIAAVLLVHPTARPQEVTTNVWLIKTPGNDNALGMGQSEEAAWSNAEQFIHSVTREIQQNYNQQPSIEHEG
jgi:hypothetical protein